MTPWQIGLAIALLAAIVSFSAVMWDNAIETLIDHEHRITKLEAQDEP